MSLISENGAYIVSLLTAGAGYFFGGRQKQKTDAVSSMQTMYQEFLSHFKGQMEVLVTEVETLKKSNLEVQKNFNDLQNAFNDLYIQYSHEVQKNADWAKMYNELKAKYEILEAQYDKLKKDFEAHKKANK